MKLPDVKAAGRWLITLGIAGLVTAVIFSLTKYSGIDRGAIPAVSFLFVMIGLCFYFPTLLQEAKGEVSAMRVVVFSVVMVFVFIYVKLGWNAGEFEEFKIDTTWVYILGLAFGSKVFQKFAEEEDEDGGKGAKPEAKDDKK